MFNCKWTFRWPMSHFTHHVEVSTKAVHAMKVFRGVWFGTTQRFLPLAEGLWPKDGVFFWQRGQEEFKTERRWMGTLLRCEEAKLGAVSVHLVAMSTLNSSRSAKCTPSAVERNDCTGKMLTLSLSRVSLFASCKSWLLCAPVRFVFSTKWSCLLVWSFWFLFVLICIVQGSSCKHEDQATVFLCRSLRPARGPSVFGAMLYICQWVRSTSFCGICGTTEILSIQPISHPSIYLSVNPFNHLTNHQPILPSFRQCGFLCIRSYSTGTF